MFLHKLAIITIYIFIITKILLGIFYFIKVPNRLICYKINNIKKKYNIVDENMYLLIKGRNNIIIGVFLLILFLIAMYFNKDIDIIIAIICIFIVFGLNKNEESFLIKK